MAEHVLVVDAETVVRTTVARILTREGFEVFTAEDLDEASTVCRRMPTLSVVIAGNPAGNAGVMEVLRRVREFHPLARTIAIAKAGEEQTLSTQRFGVDSLLARPLDMDKLLAALKRLMGLLKAERDRAALLERLRKDVVTMVDSLARALEDRDPYTAGHSLRVAEYSLLIGQELGLSDLELEVLRHGAALHDIGKIAVRQDVLHKPGRLTDEEFEHIKIHPVVGREILEPIEDFETMLDLVYYHHERIDGRGYPEGLAGEQIPLLAQIVAVADTYDAMTSDRPYRRGMHPEKALAIMNEVSGTQLNADLVKILDRKIRAAIEAGQVVSVASATSVAC